MATSENTQKQKKSNGHFDSASTIETDESTSGVSTPTNDWISAALSAASQATQMMQPFKGGGAQVSTTIAEAFFKGMGDLFRANETPQVMVVFTEYSNRQLEEWAKPISAAMQQMLDTQLQWFGNLGKMGFPQTSEKQTSPQIEDTWRNSWLNAQDQWLSMTQSWVDASKPK